jgi:hypothetical protein
LGIVALLVAALAAFALAPTLLPASYSWVEHGISESAAQGIDGAWLARLGFLCFGLAVVWLAGLRPVGWVPAADLLHLVFGVSMFGVAAFSAKPWEDDAPFVQSEDLLHSVLAGAMGFAFVVAVVTSIVVRRQRSVGAALPDWVTLVIAALVPLTMSTGIWGVLQRLMFVTAAVWYAREARLATRGRDVEPAPAPAEADGPSVQADPIEAPSL